MKKKISFYNFNAYAVIDPKVSEKIGYGGAELNLVNLAVELARDPELEITFYVGDYGENMIKTYKNITIRRLKYYDHQKFAGPWHTFMRFLVLYFALFSDQSTHYVASIAGDLIGHMRIVSHFKRMKIIFRLAHDNDTSMEFMRKHFPGRCSKLYEYGLEKADAVIAQNRFQYNRIREMYPGKRVELIKNALCIEKKGVEGAKPEKDIILWVARCERFKRPWLFVELARRMPERSFVMILPEGDSRQSAELRQQTFKLAAGVENLKILEYVPYDEIMSYFYKASLFVNTSESEGFPNTFIQASVARTPILSFVSNPDNIINRYRMGCVCGDNMDEAENFIKKTVKGQWEYLGENAFRYFTENHDITVSAGKYKEIIMESIA